MIERYTKPEMGHIWTEYNEWDTMKQVEILASEAQAELGNIPKEAAKEIREKAAFSVDRIHEIEAETHHDIAAFVSTLSENIGEAGKYVHLGLTSTDVKDTALGYMLKQASDILIKDLENFHAVCAAAPLNSNILRASAVPTASMPKRRRSASSCATGWLKSNATSTA